MSSNIICIHVLVYCITLYTVGTVYVRMLLCPVYNVCIVCIVCTVCTVCTVSTVCTVCTVCIVYTVHAVPTYCM